MTTEKTNEMSKNIKALDEFYYKDKSLREWIKIIASDDYISRAEVIELINKHMNDEGTLDDDITCILEELSPRWVWDEKAQVYRCSVCNHFPWRVDTVKNDEVFVDLKRLNAYRYCPYCGTKMEA